MKQIIKRQYVLRLMCDKALRPHEYVTIKISKATITACLSRFYNPSGDHERHSLLTTKLESDFWVNYPFTVNIK